MGDVVLVVEKDDRVRLGIRQAFKAHQTPLYEVSDPFDAMSALGRASFGAIVVSAGKRQLSLRGLCQLARKRHPGVALFVITSPGVTAAQLEQALGVSDVNVVAAGTTTLQLADRVVRSMVDPFDIPVTAPGEHNRFSSEETRPQPRSPAAPTAAPRRPPGPTPMPSLADALSTAAAAPAPASPTPPARPEAPTRPGFAVTPRPVSTPPSKPVPAPTHLPVPPSTATQEVDEPAPTVRMPIAPVGAEEQTPSPWATPAKPQLPPSTEAPLAAASSAPPPTLDADEGDDASTLPHIMGELDDDVMPPPTAAPPARNPTAIIPLGPDEPTATNVPNPLLQGGPGVVPLTHASESMTGPAYAGVPSRRAAVAPGPVGSAPQAGPDAPPLRAGLKGIGQSLDADGATLPMPVWRPSAPAEVPPPASGFSEREATAPAYPLTPGSTSDSDAAAAVSAVSAVSGGESLPAPIDLPPMSAPPSSDRADRTVPETKLRGALLDTNSSTSEGALLEGGLEDRAGAILLMTLLAQEMTGVLHVHTGDARGRLYFLHGEPVFAEHANGDAGLLQHLQAEQIVADTFRPVLDDGRSIDEGQLLVVLSSRGMLTGEAVHEFLRSFVRTRVVALIGQREGTYAFYEETAFVDTKPLLKVNSFGLILNALRRQIPPDDLMRRSAELEWAYAHPKPALAPVAEKLRPFARGTNLHEHVSGQKRVKQLLGLIGLDALMGTLLMLALEHAGLIKLAEAPMESFDDVELADSTIVQEGRMMLPDSEMEGSISADESKARDAIFSLYVRLKPLVQPHDVLGVTGDADIKAIEAAFNERMNKLDTHNIPEGSARALMVSRVEELRQKVRRAYEALTQGPGPT